MSVLIACDIFGETDAVQTLANEIGRAKIISPYGKKRYSFKDEEQAYRFFCEHVGIEKYVEQVTEYFHTTQTLNCLIGFSAGAASIWNMLGQLTQPYKGKFLGFYGGQIRHSSDLEPTGDITLISPQSEPHFCQSSLNKLLANKPNVKINTALYLHGFMNSHSQNFDAEGYLEYLDFIKHWLSAA